VKLLSILVALLAFGGAQARVAVPSFDHAIVIVFENKEWNQIVGSRDAPTFNAMAKRYALVTRYYGVTHPSLPNYLALVSGSTQRITTDCTDCIVHARNLADTLEAAGKTWKLYAESLPTAGFTGASSGRYAKKHAPFLYFRDVVGNRARLARIVPLTALRADVRAGRLPDFSFVVPNMCNSMHDCSVRTGDAWLRGVLPSLLTLPNTAVFVVFDEGLTNVRGGGHVAALVLGTAVRTGSRFTAVTSHYGLLRTIEQAWGLPFLGRSARATPITGVWK
jgi:phosphatidylinositol-3-phosphatase